MQRSCTLHAEVMYTACRGHVHCMQRSCTLHAEVMYTACRGHVHCMQRSCTLHAEVMYTACRGHVHCMQRSCTLHAEVMYIIRSLHACSLVDIRNAYRLPSGHGTRYGARRIYVVAACWPSRMAVVHKVRAAWKSAHTLCNVCAGFHVMYMYIHETGEEEKKNIDTMHHLYVFVSQRGGGRGVEEK